ncbi:MAG TPA: DNA repair protein RecO C-terminal domain-containing protein [Candidatus Eremiobacteraceae bacterium]|nr:DNA repair protein RecO C-terminal domain-containing protein [Candidatus Eremiobacteraceae bacterium]
MKSYSVEAVVLRLRPLGEADRILTLFSRERGKLHAVAKGSRKTGSRFGARLDFFNRVWLSLHSGRSLDVVTGARSIPGPRMERSNSFDRPQPSVWERLVEPDAFALASYAAEIVDALCEPDLAVPDIFDLLCELRDAIGAGVQPAALAPAVDLRLLGAFGLAPELDACARCGTPLGNRPLAGGRARLSPASGGLICARCSIEDSAIGSGASGQTYSVSSGELALLRVLRAAPLRSLQDIPDVAQVRRLTRPFVEYQLGRRSRALSIDDSQRQRRRSSKSASR